MTQNNFVTGKFTNKFDLIESLGFNYIFISAFHEIYQVYHMT